MRKALFSLLSAAILLTSVRTMAQNARETTVDFMKGKQSAFIADFPMAEGVLENALEARLEKDGFGKRNSQKGFTLHKGVSWSAVSPDKVDVYYRVDGKGDQSTITMLVSKGYDNFITNASDADMATRVQSFLNGFMVDAQAYKLRMDIEAQEKVVRKTDDAYQSSMSDGSKLVKEKERIEKEIAANQAEQTSRSNALAAEKEKLSSLKVQVK